MSVKRFFGPSVAVAVVLVLASGIYLRIRSTAEAEDPENATAGEDADRPETSASSTFDTSVPIPVVGAEVTRDTLVISVTAAAQAAPWRETMVVAQVDGRVQSIPVRENRRVSTGTPLILMDTTDLALELQSAQGALERARVQYRETLLFDDRIEDSQVRAERERAARAKSGLDEAEVALRQSEIRLDRATVAAPFSGRVANIRVTEGHRVNTGEELMTVVDIDPIKVEVQVLESEVGYLQEGGSAQTSFAAFPGEAFLGRIATINPMVDQQSRTARVTVTIPNPEGRILPGMYARVSLEARRFADRILVPKSAVLERDDRRTLVFRFEGDERGGLAKWEYVSTGLENDSLIEIIDDPDNANDTMLEPGQIVLIDGHYSLIHDARVRLSNSLRDEANARPR
jgi:HlyD family secretion protein